MVLIHSMINVSAISIIAIVLIITCGSHPGGVGSQ